MRNQKGFTMIELLIVGVILAVLATLAIPAFKTSQEAALRQEAVGNLLAVRDAQQRYYLANSSYSSAYSALDFDPTNVAGDPPGTIRHYTYAAPTATASTWSVIATRNGTGGAGNSTATVKMDHSGTITNA